MKRSIRFFRLLLVPTFCGCLLAGCTGGSDSSSPPAEKALSGPEENAGPYGYESGILEFRVRRPHHQVDETVYFRDWGRQEARYETVRAIAEIGESTVRHQITIVNPDGVFTWQEETRTGSRSPLPPPEPYQDYEKLKERFGPEGAVGRLRSLGIELGKPEMILGFTCQVFHLKGGTFWIHRGLVLRSRIRLPSYSTSREAIRFVPDATVDSSRFRFPEGVDPESFPGLTDLLREAAADDPERTRS
ncbi:MAG: hypothetical protein JXA62_02870 [Candidatus Aminicenantes bacterium]|nr:hypothetical protein [Candidatus Aminicenantes bacterium]